MIRFTMIFAYSNSAGRSAGFSESWYISTGLTDSLLKPKGLSLMQARAGLLPNTVNIVGQRYTAVNNAAFSAGGAIKSLSDNRVVTGIYNNHGVAPNQDIPQMAIQCQVQSDSSNNVKNYDIHAIPDGLVLGGIFAGDPAFNQAFFQWSARLREDGWLFRGIDFTEPKIGIASIDAMGNYVLTGNSAVTPKQYFTLLRVKDNAGKPVKGTFLVNTVASATTGQFLGWKGQVVGQSGEVRRRNFSYFTLLNGSNKIIQATTRKVGRPFNPYRGRVSARR